MSNPLNDCKNLDEAFAVFERDNPHLCNPTSPLYSERDKENIRLQLRRVFMLGFAAGGYIAVTYPDDFAADLLQSSLNLDRDIKAFRATPDSNLPQGPLQ